MSEVRCVRMWLDNQQLGCGVRDFAVVAKRKWVTIIALSTGEHARIATAEFERLARRAAPVPGNQARRLRRNAKVFGNYGGLVKEAVAGMR